MKVIAAKCSACDGDGVVPIFCTATGEQLGESTCLICKGWGTEYPPEDKVAQKHVEGQKE